MKSNSTCMGSEPRAPEKTRVARNGYTSGNHGRRGPYLPLEQRVELYNEVLQLRRQGLSYNDIIRRTRRFNGIRLTKPHISYWVRGLHQPLGRVNKFAAEPSPELGYVIGTRLSDGKQHLSGDHNYGISLEATDHDYVCEFSRSLAKVLTRKKPYTVRWAQRRWRHWETTGSSILLYQFLEQPWQRLRPYIEHSRGCTAAFLRSFFDGEGSIHRQRLTAYNADRELLTYIKGLLKRYFDIDATGPHISVKKGTITQFPRTGKTYKRNKDCCCIYIRRHSLPTFYREVGFTIRRKQRRLAEAAKQ